MKQIYCGCAVVFFLFLSGPSFSQVWIEDFSVEADGQTSGNASGPLAGTWSSTGSLSVYTDNDFGLGKLLLASNVGTEAVFSTAVVDISTIGYAILNADVYSALVEANDYVRMYYKLDGGPEIMFYELLGGNGLGSLTPAISASAIVAANTLQIIIRVQNDREVFGFCPFCIITNDVYAIDNVTITAAPVLYSRKSGTWTDVTGGLGGSGTWSANATGTPACGCVPLNNNVAIIQSTHTVTLPASQVTIGTPPTTNLAPGALDVRTGGILEFNTNGVTLGIQQGLVRVRSGGIIRSSAATITGETLSFNGDVGGATLQIDAGGTVSFEDLVYTANASNSHYITGGGSLTITDDILINASDAVLTNNITTSVAVGGDLIFDGSDSDFINNRVIDFAGALAANNTNDDGNVITNSAGATLDFDNMDALASGTGNGAYLSIFNYGTINQSGTFVDIENSTSADNDINNMNGGTWNYSGTGHDTDIRLFANNPTNTFVYDRATAQSIITPVTTDGYNNLTLDNSTKTALGNFSVSGDWSRMSDAAFTNGGFTVTFNGTSLQAIDGSGGETFAGLTINNSSTGIRIDKNISVTGTLTMNDGNINLNNLTFTLGTGATNATNGTLSHGEAATDGWFYNDGNFIRYISTTNITLGDVRGFFPMGTSAFYRPFYLRTSGVTTGGAITMTYTALPNLTSVSIADGVSTIVERSNSRWNITSTGAIAGGGTNFQIRAGGLGFSTAANANVFRLCRASSIVGTSGTNTGSGTDPRVRRDGLQLSQLVGSYYIGAVNTTSLPIVLSGFDVVVEGSSARASWTTAQEINNEFFTLEKTVDFETFTEVARVEGKGTTHESSSYSFVDDRPFIGKSYYRLKQTDFDGKFTYSKPVMIQFDGPTEAVMNVYPNPFKGEKLFVEIVGTGDVESIPVSVTDMKGQVISTFTIESGTGGRMSGEVQFERALPRGLYIVKAGKTLQLTRKIAVE